MPPLTPEYRLLTASLPEGVPDSKINVVITAVHVIAEFQADAAVRLHPDICANTVIEQIDVAAVEPQRISGSHKRHDSLSTGKMVLAVER